MPNSIEKYQRRVEQAESLLCVGLDTTIEQLPSQLRSDDSPMFAFNRWVIDQTHAQVCAYKPNIAFYEAEGEAGLRALRQTIAYLRENHPDIVIICDAKRGDMHSTSVAYARAIFDELGVDAVTLHPYLGGQSLQPFLERGDKTCIVLCRTSNPGAGDFQDLKLDGKMLWEHIAERVVSDWNSHGNCMLVMGATYPEHLRRVRQIVGDMPLLIPGIGAQGGDLQAVVQNGVDSQGGGMIISASRSVMYAEDPGMAARDLKDQINRHRAAVMA